MRIGIESGNGATRITLTGRFDAHETDEFRRVATSLLSQEHPAVLMEMSNVAFVDSSALAAMVALQREAAKLGGAVTLVNVSDPVRVILELTDLSTVFATVSDPDWNPHPR
jgi:anti-sigma B factor antagonist